MLVVVLGVLIFFMIKYCLIFLRKFIFLVLGWFKVYIVGGLRMVNIYENEKNLMSCLIVK